jgi:hypothetical protein
MLMLEKARSRAAEGWVGLSDRKFDCLFPTIGLPECCERPQSFTHVYRTSVGIGPVALPVGH